MRKAPAREGRQPAIRRDAHDRLGDTRRDDLRVCDATRSVLVPLGQETVGRDMNAREPQVEVGVHPGPRVGERY
jgi:hypothetical protein